MASKQGSFSQDIVASDCRETRSPSRLAFPQNQPRFQQSSSQTGTPGRRPMAITASDSSTPPRPCRFCGGSHWDRECTRYNPQQQQVYFTDEDAGYEEAQTHALSAYPFDVAEDVYDDQELEIDKISF